tara:strand:- start:791 stop:1699 length:909 start_codon:yes stop_codon:yes gene_type:complete
MFDLIRFCEDEGIEYKTEGKNVTEGWVNINCPFCDDPSEHLGYDPTTGKFNCWKCGGHGLWDLIGMVFPDGIRYDKKKIMATIKKYQTDEVEVEKPVRRNRTEPEEVEMPVGSFQPHHSINHPSNKYKLYLKNRGFDFRSIMSNWNIYVGGLVGEFKWRIIAPIYHKHTLVSYVGRAILKQEPKYLNMHGTNLKDYLYGYDHCQDTVIVVEGITDVWRMGRGVAVATFGTKTTMQQISLLKKFKKVGVLFDSEDNAQEEALKIVDALNLLGVEAYNLKLPEGIKDPADLSDWQAWTIAKKFF